MENYSTNETKVSPKFVACATCKYWSGPVHYKFGGCVYAESGSKGPCNNTYMGHDTFVWASCQNWEQKYF